MMPDGHLLILGVGPKVPVALHANPVAVDDFLQGLAFDAAYAGRQGDVALGVFQQPVDIITGEGVDGSGFQIHHEIFGF
jgi:hypothetical protein